MRGRAGTSQHFDEEIPSYQVCRAVSGGIAVCDVRAAKEADGAELKIRHADWWLVVGFKCWIIKLSAVAAFGCDYSARAGMPRNALCREGDWIAFVPLSEKVGANRVAVAVNEVNEWSKVPIGTRVLDRRTKKKLVSVAEDRLETLLRGLLPDLSGNRKV